MLKANFLQLTRLMHPLTSDHPRWRPFLSTLTSLTISLIGFMAVGCPKLSSNQTEGETPSAPTQAATQTETDAYRSFVSLDPVDNRADGAVNSRVSAVRSQYETINLSTLPSELRKANPWPRVKALLSDRFGRATLEEGEQPTIISQPEYTRDEYDFLIIVTVTNRGAADDSIGGFRYRFEFDPFDGDTMILAWAGSQQFCQRTQVWTRQACP